MIETNQLLWSGADFLVMVKKIAPQLLDKRTNGCGVIVIYC
ncbi:hypothetical protein [Streptococcus pluranimalium]|nr:hypothetical protein [Streptococcus pluranimalium]MDY3042047.1 hypothetical protein [Streptococcus pluranimalium]